MTSNNNNRSQQLIESYLEHIGEFRDTIDDIISLLRNYEESSSYFIHSMLLEENIVSENSRIIPERFRRRSRHRLNRNLSSRESNRQNSSVTLPNVNLSNIRRQGSSSNNSISSPSPINSTNSRSSTNSRISTNSRSSTNSISFTNQSNLVNST